MLIHRLQTEIDRPCKTKGAPEAACKVFGKMKQEGRTTAERFLEGEGLPSWPEKTAAVLEERRKALSILRGDFPDEGDDKY